MSHAQTLQSCPTVFDPIDYSPPGSSFTIVVIFWSRAWKMQVFQWIFQVAHTAAAPGTEGVQCPALASRTSLGSRWPRIQIKTWTVRFWFWVALRQESARKVENIILESCSQILEEMRKIENLVRTNKKCSRAGPSLIYRWEQNLIDNESAQNPITHKGVL